VGLAKVTDVTEGPNERFPADVKEEVRAFYDAVGWKEVSEGVYQNARFEDLRPVSQEYIHHCHLRVAEHLPRQGRYLLDAGSGPIQYPEYLTYSQGHRYRVCLDISCRALVEARKRLGDHALCIVGDIANLPFAPDCMDGVVSLHTVHHLPPGEHRRAFEEFYRVTAPGSSVAVVYHWGRAGFLSRWTRRTADAVYGLRRWLARLRGGRQAAQPSRGLAKETTLTFTHDYRWAESELRHLPGFEVRVWRTVGVHFLRAVIHPRLGGRFLLRILYGLEERAPRFFGRHGMYPLIVYRKPVREPDGTSRVNP